jgi:protein involved in polysaccharide export with SLBB domain
VPRELEQGVVPVHYIQPGDVLLIEPVDLESDVRIPADQHVLVDGSLDLLAFGRVMVAGLTLEMAENLIERTIVDAGVEQTQINVQLLEPVHRYYVLGEVNSPGSYPLDGHENVLDGILAAGGLTTAAAPCKILLARPTLSSSCRVTLPVCYREITQLGDTTSNYQIQPGDRIFVASRTWCEELMFWTATKSCARCTRCQTHCVDASIIGQTNPVTLVTAGQLPSTSQVSELNSRSQINPAQTPTNPESSMLGATNFNSDINSGPIADLERLSPIETKLPARLPTARDGELDFGSIESAERFEPLWITATPDVETSE